MTPDRKNRVVFEHEGRAYTVADVAHALAGAGVAKGDALFVHADLKSFGKLPAGATRESFLDGFVEALEETIGPKGTLIMPTFTYSFCKNEIYDPDKTPSTVGILSERFRSLPGVKRSLDALFSVAARGADAVFFTTVGTNCFGKDSIFEKLHDRNAKMVFLGETFDITFMHFVEQRSKIPYRFIKAFSGKIKSGEKLADASFDYNVRPLDNSVNYDLDALAAHFAASGIIRSVPLGNSRIRVVHAIDAANAIAQEFKKNAYFLLQNKRLGTGLSDSITPLIPEGAQASGNAMMALIRRLFPICRSITGKGVRETLAIINEQIPLEMHEIPTGVEVFDWVIPKEWTFADAYIEDSAGHKIVDAKKCNLHVLNYSIPIDTTIPLHELKQHLFTMPEQPTVIPYMTSYYKEQWGFCMSHEQYLELKEGMYHVVIDTKLESGSLTYGEYLIRGETEEEVLLTTYFCHPSMCNDNLSGVALLAELARLLSKKRPRYSYRFLFIPETIGAIAWLAKNEQNLSRIKAGLILTCVGDRGDSTYKTSKRGDAIIDRIAKKVLEDSGTQFRIIDFSPGSDERQFCSPAFNLPMGSLMRTPYAQFPEYHTSADNLDFVSAEALADTLKKHIDIIFALEEDKTYLNLNPKCEPRLGKRGLYRMIGAQREKQGYANELALLFVLAMSDGTMSLLDIAIRSKLAFKDIADVAKLLEHAGLLREAKKE